MKKSREQLKAEYMAEAEELLGVTVDADNGTIKDAYRAAAKKWHPDMWSGASEADQKEAAEKFKRYGEAREVLDKEKKKR